MSVVKRKRRTASTEHMEKMFDVFDMIDRDIAQVNHERMHYVGEPVSQTVGDLIQLSYQYEAVGRSKPMKMVERDMIIIQMNALLVELWRRLIPMLHNVKKSRQKKFDRYTEAINAQIAMNEKNYIRDNRMTDSVYEAIRGYDKRLVELAKEIVQDPHYKFERIPRFRKSTIYTAIFLQKAHELNKYTLSQVKGARMQLRLMYTDRLYQLSADIFYNCYKGNGIFPICKEEFEEREMYLKEAETCCRYYERLLFKCFGKSHIDSEHQNRWSEKYDDCHRVLCAVIKSDEHRFRKLKPKAEVRDFEKKDKERIAAIQKHEEEVERERQEKMKEYAEKRAQEKAQKEANTQ